MIVKSMEELGFTFQLPEFFDNQVTGTYLECERMMYYRHGLGRVMNKVFVGEDYNLVWGLVFHKLVEVWTERRNIEEIINLIDLNIPEEVDDRYGRNRGRMAELFAEWVKFTDANPLEIIANEQATAVICGTDPCPYSETGCNLAYAGRLDKIVKWNALVGPLDIKTTIAKDDNVSEKHRPSHQMEGYTWMTSHLIGRHCWGTIIEQAICNKSIIDIRRFPISFSEGEIREWVETERITQAEVREKAIRYPFSEIHWKQNKARCWRRGAPCTFKGVCSASPDANFRHKWLLGNSKEIRWDFQNPGVMDGEREDE